MNNLTVFISRKIGFWRSPLYKMLDLYKCNSLNYEVLFEIATSYEEFNFNKTLALNYYKSYLKEAGDKAKNADYALERMRKIKEELFIG